MDAFPSAGGLADVMSSDGSDEEFDDEEVLNRRRQSARLASSPIRKPKDKKPETVAREEFGGNVRL